MFLTFKGIKTISVHIVFNENFITRAMKLRIKTGRKISLDHPVSNIVENHLKMYHMFMKCTYYSCIKFCKNRANICRVIIFFFIEKCQFFSLVSTEKVFIQIAQNFGIKIQKYKSLHKCSKKVHWKLKVSIVKIYIASKKV